MQTEQTDDEKKFFPIPLAIMQPGTVAPVNIYTVTGSPPAATLYTTAQTLLSDEVRERLMQRDVSELYLLKEDEDAYYEYVEENIDAIIRDDLLPPEKASEIVYKSSARVMVHVFDNPRSGKNLKRAQRMVEATVLSIMKNPEALWQMTSMASHDYYTYTHCVNVCMFLVATTKDLLGISDRTRLERIGMGGIYHDIGKTEIPPEILNKAGKLTTEEFEKIKEHSALGVQLISRYRKLPQVSSSIIRGHHERLDGTGYPDGLSGERIPPVVRLSGIIDVYDALTTERSYATARAPYEALTLMLSEMDGHHLDSKLLRAFVGFLGPKEAGTGAAVHADRPAAV